MPRFLTAEGTEVSSDNPNRLLWYSAGSCGYWTDDWDKLKLHFALIPCCPNCRAVGLQSEAGPWLKAAEEYEQQGNPGYVKFLNENKEKCVPGKGLLTRYYENRILPDAGTAPAS